MKFDTGDACWVSNFPPLDGGEPKRRTAIYLDLGDLTPPATDGYHVFIGTTTDDIDHGVDYDALRKTDGLPEPCWILPRWIREVPYTAIEGPAGQLELVEIEPLINAVLDRRWDIEVDSD